MTAAKNEVYIRWLHKKWYLAGGIKFGGERKLLGKRGNIFPSSVEWANYRPLGGRNFKTRQRC